MSIKSEQSIRAGGFDAPASSRERDYLNRWPFAQEIYGIATTGPRDWSVRVGIYGEWGTGKSSVLGFVEAIARTAGHIALRFNPWEFSDSRALWHSFVISLDAELKKSDSSWEGYDWHRLKKIGSQIDKLVGPRIEKIQSAIGNEWVTLSLLGIDVLRDFFAYKRKDLEDLMAKGHGRRIIVLIDDLDRTDAAVVPEIFFALKEVMDFPGMAFISAFDPEVVGEVLGERHPGFRDGLNFLEKIIDYPRWLRTPSQDGLLRLALADAKEFCNYVPEDSLKETVPLLPANPRAVRQFIRMLTLLKPQIDRHYPNELRWSAILAANVLKVRYPRLAHSLLNDDVFWRSIKVTGLLSSQNGHELDSSITKHVEKVNSNQQGNLSPEEIRRIEAAIKSLCAEISVFLGFGYDELAYQMNVAEAPHAVTAKEFDGLFARWNEAKYLATVDSWIGEHANKLGRLYVEVFRETFDLALRSYTKALENAENVLIEAEQSVEMRKAESLFGLLECLAIQLGRLEKHGELLDEERFGSLLNKFASFAGQNTLPEHQELRPKEAALVMELVQNWEPPINALFGVLQRLNNSARRNMEAAASRQLYLDVFTQASVRFASEVLRKFGEEDFINRAITVQAETHGAISILLDVKGPLWNGGRAEALAFFREESKNLIVRDNVFVLLHWFSLVLKEKDRVTNPAAIEAFLRDGEIVTACWSALISTPLSRRAILWLRDLPSQLANLGTTVLLPDWWIKMLSTSDSPNEETET